MKLSYAQIMRYLFQGEKLRVTTMLEGQFIQYKNGDLLDANLCVVEFPLNAIDAEWEIVSTLRFPEDKTNPTFSIYDQDFIDVYEELLKARQNWPPQKSAHEGWAVLYEEVDELWEMVKTKQRNRKIPEMRKEAIQIAVMAMRFIKDCCTEGGAGYGK